ncbi:Alpha/beta hydrolase family protein [Paenibacillus sp. yr247]|uniref:alpha/beta hydrolase n=1 Tax=Paenibacillus sp. yr247 TaxID=1761880 RepID=UPI000883F1C4|nr:alpha/beta hydrolase [Paenibacillus sp. yr247]SDN73284.1 Alpha/beta hydrolase family protein [Paenibacillus sp. yr247]
MLKAFKRHWWKWVFALLVLMVALIYWYLRPYRPDIEALAAMKSTEEITVRNEGQVILFEPKKPVQPSMIYYPGGLVEPESYAPYAQALAQADHRIYIVKMPVNLAIFGGDRAASILATKHQDETFVIGGHSLGGVMAARFAAMHANELAGVFFLASYPDSKGSLVSANLPVLSLVGSNDGAVNQDALMKAKANLPNTTEYHTIQGGNHSQFGSYGFQRGDLPSSISAKKQLDETIKLLLNWEQTAINPVKPTQ